MLLHDLFELKTKSGSEVIMSYDENTERVNRGWVVDKVTATVDGELAGYIKVSYIPTEEFNKFYPNIFAWKSIVEGGGFNFIIDRINGYDFIYEKLSPKKRQEFLEDVARQFLGEEGNEYLSQFKTDNDVLREIQHIEAVTTKHHGNDFKAFVEFHVDKPNVDFIQVEPILRRNRIGLALYLEAAAFLKKKGLKLHASGVQSPSAVAAWEYLEKYHNVKYTKASDGSARRYLEV